MPEALAHRSFAEGALTRLLVRVPASLLAHIDAPMATRKRATTVAGGGVRCQEASLLTDGEETERYAPGRIIFLLYLLAARLIVSARHRYHTTPQSAVVERAGC